jgi:hypothetical protein
MSPSTPDTVALRAIDPARLVDAADPRLAAALAAAGLLGIHTGLFGAPGMTENDTSEFLRTNGHEMRR